jgi:adenosylcobinamide-phosphate synthase
LSHRGAATIAMLLDWVLGEPPAAVHPTVWMGHGIRALQSHRRATSRAGACAEGAGTVLSVAVVAALASRFVPRTLAPLALKPALSLRALLDAGRAVESALRAGRLDEARRLVSYHLVSRDTTTLDASDVAGAAISSLAENLNDSVVAPLVAFRIAGLGGAYAYRAINTADAMLGYHTPELEWFGKPAARIDDVVNWLPARLSAGFIAVASGAPRAALAAATADARRAPSPNGGWPMAAMAGALGVVLVKRGVYTLHARGRPPAPADIARARHITARAAALATAFVEVV